MLQKPIILAVETSSRTGSIALAKGDNLLAQRTFSAPLRHSSEIFPAMIELLDQFNLSREHIDQVYISIGPGSFTGLRIAVTIAKIMNLANSVQIVTVNSLDAIATNLATEPPQNVAIERIATILDAKRGQFYTAVYERMAQESSTTDTSALPPGYRILAPNHSFWRKIGDDRLIRVSQFLDEFADPSRPIYVMGDGLLYHQDRFQVDGVQIIDSSLWSPRAENVYVLGYQKAQAGQFEDPVSLVPLYLRAPQVTLRKNS